MITSQEMYSRERLRARLALQIRKARRCPKAYAEFVGRKEGNRPIIVSEAHAQWHDDITHNDRIVLHAPVGHGKSNQITRWRTEFELGNDPNLRFALISSSQQHPKKVLDAIKLDVLNNKRVKVLFPHLKPSTSPKLWRSTAVRFERDDIVMDPSIQVFGAFGRILGSRLDVIVLDDFCTLENTLTQMSRDKLFDWLSSEVLSRYPPEGRARFWALGHVWDDDDALMRLGRQLGYKHKIYSCYRDNGEPLIPEMWTREKLEAREKELGPVYASLMLHNKLSGKVEGRVKRQWFQTCLQRGRGLRFLPEWDTSKGPTFTGVDLGTRTTGDLTVIFTVALMPNEHRRIINIESGKWDGPEILERLRDTHHRYGSIIGVENNNGQDFINQFANELYAMPIKPHTTGRNKHHVATGVESIGIEIHNGMWIIPCTTASMKPGREVSQFIRDTISYTPDTHMGDHLSAAWICRETIRKYSRMSTPTWVNVSTNVG